MMLMLWFGIIVMFLLLDRYLVVRYDQGRRRHRRRSAAFSTALKNRG